MTDIKVRFAPSPTGNLHVGNLRTALVNFLFVRRQGGHFMLRIDDTDTDRSTAAFEASIREDLQWMGMQWDSEDRQSARLARYDDALQTLLADGRALLLLWSLSLLLLLVLLWIRNGFGLLVVVVVLAGTVAVTWYADARTQSALALLLAWLLLLAAPRPLVELLVGGRAGRRGSDPDQLARLTRIPSVLWTLLLLAASVSGLVVGVSTLAPDLLAR